MLYENKYVKNKYRCLPHLDTITNDFPRYTDGANKGNIIKSFDDIYISCGRGNSEIYTTHEIKDGNEVLVLYVPSVTVAKDVIDNYKDLCLKITDDPYLKPSERGTEFEFYFLDKDLPKFAKLVKARTKGAKISPLSKENLPSHKEEKVVYNDYKMPKDWFKTFRVMYSTPICRLEKIKVSEVWNTIYKDFGKYKKINLELKAKKENYKIPHYIHKEGMWEEFENYLRERVNK